MKGKDKKQKVIHFSEDIFLNTLMNFSKDTVYFKDLDSRFLMNSKEHLRQFDTDNPEDVLGKTDFDFFPEDFAQRSFDDEQEIIKTGKPITGIIERLEKEDGSVVWFSASKYPFHDGGGHIIGTWGVTRDITPLKEYEERLFAANKKLEMMNTELQEISVMDGLTGLYNRRHFYSLLGSMIKEIDVKNGEIQDLSVMMLDIDAFKSINDTHGHMTGDKVIAHIAAIMKANTGITDVCFRYGGDEFAILCPNADSVKAAKVGEKIRKQVTETCFKGEENCIDITVSIGVSNIFEIKNKTADKIVDLADRRLYQSKQNGRNQVSS